MLLRPKCILIVLLSFFSFKISAQNFDINVLKSIYTPETSFKNGFSKSIAHSVTFVNIVAPLGTLTAGIIKHDKKLEMDALYMAGAYLTSAIITHGLKNTIKRIRPFEEYPTIITMKRDAGGGYSFPSGHTSAAFCTATSLSIYFPKWYVIVPSYLYAATVGWARMYQGVHYPTDVLAGAVVGAGSAWLTYKIQKWMDKKKNLNKISE